MLKCIIINLNIVILGDLNSMSRFITSLKLLFSKKLIFQYEIKNNKVDTKFRFYNFYSESKDLIYYKVIQPVTVFKESIIRTIQWLPIIWKDRPWDYAFIYIILKNKLTFTRRYIEKYGLHLNKSKDCRNILIAEILIQRLLDDTYVDIDLREHSKKWGKLVRGRNKDNILFDNKWSNSGLCRENVKSQKDWEQEKKEASQIYEHSTFMAQRDRKYLFTHLEKHIEEFWD